MKEERFRFGNGYDQVEDVIGVAQPVRFNSKHPTHLFPCVQFYWIKEDFLDMLKLRRYKTSFSLHRKVPQRLAPLREDGQLLQSVPQERELLAGRGYLPEGQRLIGYFRDQWGAAVHP